MVPYKILYRLLSKPVEFILLSLVTILVSPLLLLVAFFEIAERLKQKGRRKQWSQKIHKDYYRNRNNPVTWG